MKISTMVRALRLAADKIEKDPSCLEDQLSVINELTGLLDGRLDELPEFLQEWVDNVESEEVVECWKKFLTVSLKNITNGELALLNEIGKTGDPHDVMSKIFYTVEDEITRRLG